MYLGGPPFALANEAMRFTLNATFREKLKDVYNPVAALKFRKEAGNCDLALPVQGASMAVRLMEGQEDDVSKWFAPIDEGNQALRAAAVKAGVDPANVERTLSLSTVASGAEWSSTNFTEMMLGKVVVVLTGSTFIAGVPFSWFEKGKGVGEYHESIVSMSRGEIVAAEGFYALLGENEAVYIPPGWFVLQANIGVLDFQDAVTGMEGKNGCDFAVARW